MNTTERRFGKYELQELLGRGGMAEVWRALDTQLQRSVAIKLLHADLQTDPGFISRFTREAQLIASLHHPNIAQIYDFHVAEDGEDTTGSNTIAYMVMDYVAGQTLAQYIHETSQQGKFPPPADIVRLLTPISLAIDYAHQHDMIHRDIKPANILLDSRHKSRNAMGEPILSDFGLAKLLGAAAQSVTAGVSGTPRYISPEQVLQHPVSDQTDIYSLGVVLYEILVGVPPFQGDDVASILMQHLTGIPIEPHVLNPQLPPAVSKVILKSLAKDPRDRFPSAASMIAALAEAFNLPVPEDLKQASAISTRQAQLPDPEATILSSSSVSSVVAMAPSTDGETVLIEDDALLTQMPTRAEATSSPSLLPDSDMQLSEQAKNAIDLERKSAVAHATSQATEGAMQTPAGTPPPLLPSTPSPAVQKQRRLLIALVAALLIILVSGGLGTFFLLTHRNPTTTAVTKTIVGQAFFVSSGQVNETTNQGSTDEFQINLQNIPDPPSGKSYYAWLLPDKNQVEAAPFLLGMLPVSHGVVHFSYPGDSQHSNLLATTSRFLITEEDATVTPSIPSPDLKTWRYYAELPQTIPPGQTYSLLDHLRHLLAMDPTLKMFHLPGGLNIWTYRNTQAIFGWAANARDSWSTQNFTVIHRRVVSILDYLDGAALVQQDVPPGMPILADPHVSQIGLLELGPAGQQQPPGYIYHIGLHLNGVLASPGSTQYQRNLATQIDTAINNVNGWLEQERQDAIQLARMNDAQLALPSSLTLLNDMVTQANNAYTGRTDPATGQLQPGVSQIYLNVQRLATFDVALY